MFNYDQFKENYEIVKEVCKLYRKELTDMAAYVAQKTELSSEEDYRRFSDGLSYEEFCGMYSNIVANNYRIEEGKAILNGNITIEEFVNKSLESFNNCL